MTELVDVADSKSAAFGRKGSSPFAGIFFSFFGAVAQWLEQGTHNPLVVGSNPTGPTLFIILDFLWSSFLVVAR